MQLVLLFVIIVAPGFKSLLLAGIDLRLFVDTTLAFLL